MDLRTLHRPAPGVPAWAVRVAAAIPLVVLPSSIWRVTVVWFFPPDGSGPDDLPPWLPIEVYVVLLSVVSEALAFSAYALVTRWGSRLPSWLVGVPAALGAVALVAITCLSAVTSLRGVTVRGDPLPDGYPLHTRDLEGVLAILAYAPLLLWGPLLATLTVAYWRRSRSGRTKPDSKAAIAA
jgi:hypothetical protein